MSVAGSSVGSQRSRNAYRSGNRTGNNVDETLFGGGGNKTQGRGNDKEITITGKDTVQVRYKNNRRAPAAGKGDAVVIPASELNRLRDNATLLSKAEQDEIKKRAEESYNSV